MMASAGANGIDPAAARIGLAEERFSPQQSEPAGGSDGGTGARGDVRSVPGPDVVRAGADGNANCLTPRSYQDQCRGSGRGSEALASDAAPEVETRSDNDERECDRLAGTGDRDESCAEKDRSPSTTEAGSGAREESNLTDVEDADSDDEDNDIPSLCCLDLNPDPVPSTGAERAAALSRLVMGLHDEAVLQADEHAAGIAADGPLKADRIAPMMELLSMPRCRNPPGRSRQEGRQFFKET